MRSRLYEPFNSDGKLCEEKGPVIKTEPTSTIDEVFLVLFRFLRLDLLC